MKTAFRDAPVRGPVLCFEKRSNPGRPRVPRFKGSKSPKGAKGKPTSDAYRQEADGRILRGEAEVFAALPHLLHESQP